MRIFYNQLLTKTCHLFEEAGLHLKHARFVSEAICMASLRGTDSHGIRLLPHYLEAISSGRINSKAKFSFEQTSLSTGVLDANHGIGHAAVAIAMDRAIALAENIGTGFVSVKNSNHCGAMAYYSLRAARKEMIGLACTNASPNIQVFNARKSYFGINPICVAVPMEGEDPFCYDAAPSVMSNNKIKMYRKKGIHLPEGVAANEEGDMTTDPAMVSMLLPLGGDEAGYKGYGMAMLVDIFCSLLSGMPGGKDVSTMYTDEGGNITEKRYLGQFVGAIRIDRFQDVQVFKRRLSKTADEIRKMKNKVPTNKFVMIPGDPEKQTTQKRRQTGIEIPEELKVFFC